MYRVGYFRDLNPDVEMDTVLVIEWVTLFTTVALTLSSLVVWAIGKGKKKRLIALINFVVIVAVSSLCLGCTLTFNEAYKDRPDSDEYSADTSARCELLAYQLTDDL
jgi:hypothetical protein